MGLFTPYLSDNRNTAMSAVERLKDENKLFQAATESKIKDVQKLAISKIENQDLLYDVANSNTCQCHDEAIAKLNEEKLIRFINESRWNGLKPDAVKRIHNQEYLLRLINTSDSPYIRAGAISNLDPEHVDMILMRDLAIKAAKDDMGSAPDANAAIDKITDEAILLEIALSGSASHLYAAERLKTDEALTEYLVNTTSEFDFNHLAPKITDSACRERLLKEAKIKNPKVLNKLFGKKELLAKCLKNKAPKLVAGCYDATWDAAELGQLAELCNDNSLKEKINNRIKTLGQFKILESKGYPVSPDENTNRYIEALHKELDLYRTVKTTVNKQGRSIDFDAIYGLSGENLNQAIMQGCGLSIIYFLGGPLVGGLLLMGPSVKLSDEADKAVWAVVAELQLAEENTVVSRLSASISKADAAALIHDMIKLQYEKIN